LSDAGYRTFTATPQTGREVAKIRTKAEPPMNPVLPDLPATGRPAAALREKAIALEAAFLSEMLRHAGADRSAGSFGGGVGETQFASFLRDEQARAIARSGGIGLAEVIFRSLADRAGQSGG
jgi:peptidoglycan hydrolase FlgJ